MAENITAIMAYEIPFFDVDSYRIVWHGNYPKYFEMGRCQLLELIGSPYSEMEKQGFFFPVVELRVKYVKPIEFKQEIIIESTLVEWQNRLKINYLLKDNKTKEVLTKATTFQMAIKMPERITQFESPPFLLEKVSQHLGKA